MDEFREAIPGHSELPWRVESRPTQQNRRLSGLQLPQASGSDLNADLLLHKYALAFRSSANRDRKIREELSVIWNVPTDDVSNHGEYKRMAVQAVVNGMNQACKAHKAQLSCLQRRRYESLTGAGCQLWERTAASRLFLGLGSKGIWETSVRCHPHWGFPQVDGSGLKGVARAWAALTWLDQSDSGLVAPADKLDVVWPDCPASLRGLDVLEALQVVFGNGHGSGWSVPENHAGLIVFHDAWPAHIGEDGCYVAEVINPHYSDYYSSEGRSSPTDNMPPVPTPHVAVRHGLKFQFLITVGTTPSVPVGTTSDWLALARFVLDQALTELGFGGKRTSGYGFFQPSSSPASSGEARWSPSQELRAWTLERFRAKKGERAQLKKILECDKQAGSWLNTSWQKELAGLKGREKKEILQWLEAVGIKL